MSSPRVVPLWARIARLDPSILTAPGKAVLLILASFADADGGSCFPTTARIAAETGLCRRTVCRALGRLRAVGAIKGLFPMRQARQTHRAMSYQITIDHLTATPRPEPMSVGGGGVPPCATSAQGLVTKGGYPLVPPVRITVSLDQPIKREREIWTSAPPPRAPDGGLGGADPVRDEIRQALGVHRIPNKPDQVEDWHRMLTGPAWKVPPRRWAARTAINWLVGSSGSHLTWYDRCAPLLGLWSFNRNAVLRQGLAEWRESQTMEAAS